MDTLCMRLLLSGICIAVSSGFTIRLWPFNKRGTEGFVEVYNEGEWGFLGYPNYRFSDLSASYLCRSLQISEFGYGGIYTPVGSYKGFSWLSYIDCKTNGTCLITPYARGPPLDVNEQSYTLRYGNSLHCVDSKLINGETHNVGILQTVVYGQIYTVCFDGFDMNAAEVLCNHLGFHGAVSIYAVDSDATQVYYKTFICDGSEYSLLQCNQSNDEILNCQKIVQITCKAVRLMSTNEYNDEGAVEVFYNGTWGFVGNPDYAVSDQTARYLCDRFGLGQSGFGALAHTLEDYDRIAWYDRLECLGNETHIMQCDHDNPNPVPPLNNTYFIGSWLYCFDFNITNVRLENGSSYRDGRVQLEINGRWGSICTVDIPLNEHGTAGNILCQTMGFRSAESVYEETGKSTDLFWMNHVQCSGSETAISECDHLKGSYYSCYDTPTYLGIVCNDYNDCESNPCLNNGSCVDAFQNYSCECPRPWGGDNCETDIEDNCALDLCFNGATCVDRFESFECHCVDGFDGELCQNRFTIRLWPLNERGTEGFVEVYNEGEWGFLGFHSYRFSDLSASYLCRSLQISEFGYGGIYTHVGSYKGFSWLSYIDCKTNGTCLIPPYARGQPLGANEQSYILKYGNSLHCVDSKLINGETHNVGILQTDVYGQIYTVCFDGFDMNAAEVLCNHLGFHGAVSISAVDSDATQVYYKTFVCDGSELSLLQCNQSNDEILSCQKIVQITCQAVRLMSTNEYNDEGAVEIFYKGTWGFVGDPGYAVSDQTARYLCDRFGLGQSGFGAMAHSLEDYDRSAWYHTLECLGNETHIMQCDHDNPSAVPPLNNTYFIGSWLYCFDFKITNVRLVNGSSYRDGRVQLEINGRWGSICTVKISLNELEIAGNILCQTMGFRSAESFYQDAGKSTDLFWMNNVRCSGSETSISECDHLKGSHYSRNTNYNTPTYLGLVCNDYNDCESNPCLNDGSCIDAFKNYSCKCPRPWGGVNCETDTEDNCALGMCFNGATCVDRFESFECHCVDGFDGELCQNIVTDQTLFIEILALAASFLLIVTVMTACCFVRYRRRKGKKDNYRLDESKPTGQSDGTAGSEQKDDSKSDGYTNLYSTISVNLTDYSTVNDIDDEEVYNVIKDTDVDVHSPPIQTADSKLKKDEHGYISFEAENKETVKHDNERSAYAILSQEHPSEITADTNNVLRDSYLIPQKAAASDGSYLSSNTKTFGTESVGRNYNTNPTDPEDYDDIEQSTSTIYSHKEDHHVYRNSNAYVQSPCTRVVPEIEGRDTNTQPNDTENYDDIEQCNSTNEFNSESPDADLKLYNLDDYDDIVQSPATTLDNTIGRDSYLIPKGRKDYCEDTF